MMPSCADESNCVAFLLADKTVHFLAIGRTLLEPHVWLRIVYTDLMAAAAWTVGLCLPCNCKQKNCIYRLYKYAFHTANERVSLQKVCEKYKVFQLLIQNLVKEDM
jgi:hypothetical protein